MNGFDYIIEVTAKFVDTDCKYRFVGKLFQITDAQTLKARVAKTVLIAGTVRRARDTDLSVNLVPVTYCESKEFKYCGDDVARALYASPAIMYVMCCLMGNQCRERRSGLACVHLGCCITIRAIEFCNR